MTIIYLINHSTSKLFNQVCIQTFQQPNVNGAENFRPCLFGTPPGGESRSGIRRSMAAFHLSYPGAVKTRS
jgi:hypothetical protein